MKRTTVFMPIEVDRDLKGLARREGKPVAWLVREALTAYVDSRRPAAKLPSFVGVSGSGTADVAERHEELLWADPHGAGAKQPSRRPPRRRASTKKR